MYDRNSIPVPRHLDPPSNVPDVSRQALVTMEKQASGITRDASGHLAAITYLDTQIGKVLDELERSPDDTIIVWWSDHGLHLASTLTRTTAFELTLMYLIIHSRA